MDSKSYPVCELRKRFFKPEKTFEFDDTALSLPAWLTEESNPVTPKNESCTLEAQRLPPPVIELRMSTQPLLHGQSHVHYNCGTYRHFN